MRNIKYLLKYRFTLSIILALLGILALTIGCVLQNYYQILGIILVSLGSTFISSAITIFLFKHDILDIIKKDNFDDYGILQIVTGRNTIFTDENARTILNAKSWTDLFDKSKNIDVVGVSLYGFLLPDNLYHLLDLSKKGYKIRLFFGNPESEEVSYQSKAENKPGTIKNHIYLAIEIMKKEFKKLSNRDSAKVKANFEVYFSETMPKANIIRCEDIMIITSYLLNGPYKEPTLIVRKGKEFSYFNRYQNYIDNIITSATKKKLEE
jgi:hypothetical protein